MTERLGLFTNDASKVFQSSVIAGAREVAERAGLSLEVHELPRPPAESSVAIAMATATRGSLVLANVLGDAVLSELAKSGHAVTLVSHRPPGLGVASVQHDNRQGMRQLVEHLVGAGRSHFVYVGGNREQLDGVERERYFREELMRHSLEVPPERFLRGDFRPDRAAASMRALLERDAPLDAVVAADYLMAIAVMRTLRTAGMSVPEDVSVVGFGDGPEAARAGLTVVGADVVELGRRSARQLIAQVQAGRLRGHTLIRTRLMVRGS